MPRKAIHASTISVCASRIPVLHSQSAEGKIKESNSDDLTCLKYEADTKITVSTDLGKSSFYLVVSTRLVYE